MIEVVSRVVSHAELLHDAPGPHVGRDRERHQLFQPEHLERVTNNFPRALCGQSLALIVGGQSPPNLDAWSEVGMERGNSKADETDKAAVPPQLRAVQAETVLSEMTLDLIYQPIAFLQRKSAGHELHHTRASALGKNDPFVLSKSYPHEEQDLAQCKCVSALSSTPKACKPLIPRRRLTAGTDENPSLMFGAEQNRRFCHPAVGHSW